jgi:hypothetical protein
MKLIDRTVKVPAISQPSERGPDGEITNAVRAHFGRAALEAGTPDHGLNGEGTDGCRTDATDTIANVLHWLHHRGIDPVPVLASAERHFRAEAAYTIEERAVRILRDAGLDAYLEHTGGGIWVAEVVSTEIPDRIVWIVDSEGEEAGPFMIVAYPVRRAEDCIDKLSGASGEADLVDRVRRALSELADS